MKRIIIFISFLLTFLSVHAQDADRFTVQNGMIVWKNVYQSPLDSASIIRALTLSKKIDNVENLAGVVSFDILRHRVDYTGYKRMRLPIFLAGMDFRAHASIEFREGRYRVTVDHLNFIDDPGQYSLGTSDLENHYKPDGNGAVDNRFYSSHAAELIDRDLEQMFTINEEQEEEW